MMKSRTVDAVDLFCGAGAASEAYERVCRELGLDTSLIAINHWQTAIDTHDSNHPEGTRVVTGRRHTVRHLCASVEHVNPQVEVPGGRLHLLMAGPECIFHSRARGGKPVNDQRRSTAWKVVDWLTALYIENVLIENVPEFREWGPLGANGKPLKSKRGETYRAFINAIRSLGYKVEERVLCSADYGDPTTRERLFIIARRGNRSISWPEPTHSRTGSPSLLRTTKKWRAAREVIDWTIPSRSIFDPTRKPISPKTFARIIAGLERFGGKDLQPFIVQLRGTDDAHVASSAKSVDEPLSTVTASGTHHALCEPEPFMLHLTHGGRERSLDTPFPTVTGAHRGELAVCEPAILPQGGGGSLRPVAEPMATVATDGAHMLVEPFLVAAGGPTGTGRNPKDLADPFPTVLTNDRTALIEPFIMSAGGPKVGAIPVSLPMNTVLTRDHMAVVEPFVIHAAHGTKPGDTETRRAQSLGDPLGTVIGSNRFALIEPFIASYYGTQNISPVTAPLPTVTTKDRFALVMPVVNGKALDIRLRMLQPKELAGAMSLDGYTFRGTKGDQVKQIGNAWSRRLGQALIRSLLKDYVQVRADKKLEATA